ncbi:hypothetical protein AGLY_004035, partial [Aphis glycines]
IKFVSRSSNAVIYTSNPAGPFKAPPNRQTEHRCLISYTSTIIIYSPSILYTHSEVKYFNAKFSISFPSNIYRVKIRSFIIGKILRVKILESLIQISHNLNFYGIQNLRLKINCRRNLKPNHFFHDQFKIYILYTTITNHFMDSDTLLKGLTNLTNYTIFYCYNFIQLLLVLTIFWRIMLLFLRWTINEKPLNSVTVLDFASLEGMTYNWTETK